MLAYGASVDGLVTRLFTATTEKEIDATLTSIGTQYAKIHKAEADLQKLFKKLGATKELAVLNRAAALNGVYASLTTKDGIVPKLKNRLVMQEMATQESVKLRNIVMQQAQKSRQTSSAAQGEQEKSISDVNGMIRKSLFLTGLIGLSAIVLGLCFGIWIYRAISSPLAGLITAAESIASGDLKCSISTERKDEIGQVQSAMAGMVISLQGIAKKIGLATDTLAINSDGLSSTATALEKGTEEQTGRIEQSAVAMTEMSQTINDVSDNAHTTAVTAAAMREAANTAAGLNDTAKWFKL